MKLTIQYKQAEEGGYIAQVKELPAVISEGETIEETRGNILDALNLYIEYIFFERSYS
ncbi:MAG: type II toxin-antitoxin system HicB family antitoxin [Thermonemataceae bacterium]